MPPAQLENSNSFAADSGWGPDERRVVWARPTQSPIGLTPELWATLPDTLPVRLVRRYTPAHAVDLQRLSFAGARRRLRARLPYLPRGCGPAAWHRLLRLLLHDSVADRVPDRPGRKEPRALKRRHKVLPYLGHPRPVAREMAYYDGLA